MKAEEFYTTFEESFSTQASAAGLRRSRGKALKWSFSVPGGTKLTIGFRLNRKNLSGYPGEFMPDIAWNGPPHNQRDDGEVSFYQYLGASHLAKIYGLQRQVVDSWIRENNIEPPAGNVVSLASMLVERSRSDIVPNIDHWLPYWSNDNARAWGEVFGSSIAEWLQSFLKNPETREAWCWRVLWSKT